MWDLEFYNNMFVAEALYKFSKEVLEAQNQKEEEEEPLFKEGEGKKEDG